MYRHALYFEYGIRVVFISYMCHTDVIPTISCYNLKKNCLCRCVVSIPVFMPVSMSMHSSSIGQLYNKSKQSHPLLGKCPAYVASKKIQMFQYELCWDYLTKVTKLSWLYGIV